MPADCRRSSGTPRSRRPGSRQRTGDRRRADRGRVAGPSWNRIRLPRPQRGIVAASDVFPVPARVRVGIGVAPLRAPDAGVGEESWMASSPMSACARARAGRKVRYVPNVVDVAPIRSCSRRVRAPRALLWAITATRRTPAPLQFLVEQVMPRVWLPARRPSCWSPGHNLELPPDADPRVPTAGLRRAGRRRIRARGVRRRPAARGRRLAAEIRRRAGAWAPGGRDRASGRRPRGAGRRPLPARGRSRCVSQALSDILDAGDEEMARRGRQLAERAYSVEALAAILRP